MAITKVTDRVRLVRPAVKFGKIDWTTDKVLIVATGPSVSGVTILRRDYPGVYIIAVKQAIKTVEAHCWITVDPNIRARVMMKKQRRETLYVAAVPDDYGTEKARVAAHVGNPEKDVLYLRRIEGKGPLKSMYGLSEDNRALHTGNSAYGALGLAYLTKPRKIGIIGLDGNQLPHGIGEGAPRGNLSHLPELFASSLEQLKQAKIQVVNGNLKSKVRCFPMCTREELLSWIKK